MPDGIRIPLTTHAPDIWAAMQNAIKTFGAERLDILNVIVNEDDDHGGEFDYFAGQWINSARLNEAQIAEAQAGDRRWFVDEASGLGWAWYGVRYADPSRPRAVV